MTDTPIEQNPQGPQAPESLQPDTARPDWLPQNFEHPEQLVEAYNSLQSNQLPPLMKKFLTLLPKVTSRTAASTKLTLRRWKR